MIIRSHVCARQVFWNRRLGYRGSEQHVDSWLQVGLSSDDNHALMNDFIIEFCFAAKLQPQLNESFYSVTGLKTSHRSLARASSRSIAQISYRRIITLINSLLQIGGLPNFQWLQIGGLINCTPFNFILIQLVDRLVNRTQSTFRCIIIWLPSFRRDSIKPCFEEIKFSQSVNECKCIPLLLQIKLQHLQITASFIITVSTEILLYPRIQSWAILNLFR